MPIRYFHHFIFHESIFLNECVPFINDSFPFFLKSRRTQVMQS